MKRKKAVKKSHSVHAAYKTRAKKDSDFILIVGGGVVVLVFIYILSNGRFL